jgi:hypothetical protein
MRILIRGLTELVGPNEQPITDPVALQRFDGVAYDTAPMTNHLGGVPVEDELKRALIPGGYLTLEYQQGSQQLWVRTEYALKRPLNEAELVLLVKYTVGQCRTESARTSLATHGGFTALKSIAIRLAGNTTQVGRLLSSSTREK